MADKSKIALLLAALGFIFYLSTHQPPKSAPQRLSETTTSSTKAQPTRVQIRTTTLAADASAQGAAKAMPLDPADPRAKILAAAAKKVPARSIASIAPDADKNMVERLQESQKLFAVMELTTELADNISTEKTGDDQHDALMMELQHNFAADANVMALATANGVELSHASDDYVGSKEPDGCVARFGQCSKHPDYTGRKLRISEAGTVQACMARTDDFAAYCENAGAVNLSFYQDGHLVDSRTTIPQYIRVEQ